MTIYSTLNYHRLILLVRRGLLGAALATCAVAWGAGTAVAETANTYPSKTVKVIVGFPPGGSADVLARILCQKLSVLYKQSFIVENKPGAGGTIGASVVAHSAPDGYTLLLGVTASQTIAPSMYKSLAYNAAKDFAPITLLANIPIVLEINPSVPAKNVKELISLAKSANPPLTFGSSGVGAIPHLTGEIFQKAAGVKLLHVPYKGSTPALTDLIAGRVQIMFDNLTSSLPFIQTDKLRVLAIAGPTRIAALPNVPTLTESGVPMSVRSWFGLLAPAGTPQEIVDRLSKDIGTQMKTSETRKTLSGLGAELATTTPEAFAEIIRADTKQWADTVQLTGIKAQ
ncbi:MAG: tripartite tricarboxylate transporter substrate binding protein [Herbaspirillum sp.]